MAGRRRSSWFAIVVAALVAAPIVAVPGIAPANVQEQRARLPPAATCTDPVVGIWMAHKYEPMWGEWSIFTLQVTRVAGSATDLQGEILSESWSGGPGQELPPPCTAGVRHWIIHQTARGTVTGQDIHFWGTAWRIQQQQCDGWAGYNLDHFSGTIDPAIQEFQSVNNDGGRAVNDPRVFRRVRCLDNPTPPRPNVTTVPPPFHPPRRGGC